MARGLNFGGGLLAEPVSQNLLTAAIEAYDPADASLVADALRAEASIDDCVAQYLTCYAAAIADPEPIDLPARAAATAAWIEDLTPSTATGDWHRVATELFGLAAGPQVAASQAIEALLAELREAVVRPSIAQLLWRRLTPLSVREALYRWLTERPRN